MDESKMPPLKTAQEMRERAALLEQEARADLARAKQLRRSAAVIDRALAKAILQARTDSATLAPMSDTDLTVPRGTSGKIRGPRLNSTGPVPELAKFLGVSVPALAGLLGVEYETLKAQNRRRNIPAGTERAMTALRQAKENAERESAEKPKESAG